MEKVKSNRQRIDYIDLVRGIAMICIIADHLGNNTIIRAVFPFHVPVFLS